jgi:hypothetical protein
MLRRGAQKTTPIMTKGYGTIASPHVSRVVLVALQKKLDRAVGAMGRRQVLVGRAVR